MLPGGCREVTAEAAAHTAAAAVAVSAQKTLTGKAARAVPAVRMQDTRPDTMHCTAAAVPVMREMRPIITAVPVQTPMQWHLISSDPAHAARDIPTAAAAAAAVTAVPEAVVPRRVPGAAAAVTAVPAVPVEVTAAPVAAADTEAAEAQEDAAEAEAADTDRTVPAETVQSTVRPEVPAGMRLAEAAVPYETAAAVPAGTAL